MQLSVLTCVHNQRPELFTAAACSVAALGPDVEWIVVDDGSDSIAASQHERIARSSGPSSGRTKYYRLNTHGGLSIARNEALSLAQGEWVAVLDSDDELTLQLPAAIRNTSDTTGLVSMAAEYFSLDPAFVEHRPVARYESLFKKYGLTELDPFLWFDFYYHGLICRRAAVIQVGGYDTTLEVGEDQDVLFRVAEVAGKNAVVFVNEIGYRYRQNPMGVCATRWQDVHRGYTRTMTAAMRRRGAPFVDCRLSGLERLDGAEVDCYEYLDPSLGWTNWRAAARNKE